MKRRRLVAVVATVAAATVGVLGPAGPARGSVAAKPPKAVCRLEKFTVQTAEEAFYAAKKRYGSVADLITDDFLSGKVTYYKVTLRSGGASYKITAVKSKGCT